MARVGQFGVYFLDAVSLMFENIEFARRVGDGKLHQESFPKKPELQRRQLLGVNFRGF